MFLSWCVLVFEHDIPLPSSWLDFYPVDGRMCFQNVCLKVCCQQVVSIMLSHWCTTSLSLQFWQLQLFASHCINKTKGKPFPFKCSWVSVVSRLWGGWLQNQSSLYGMQRFSRLALTLCLLSGGYQLFHGQDKNLTTGINLKLKVKKQTCAFYILMACPCISPGATLPFHHFLQTVYQFTLFCLQYLSCLVQYKKCRMSVLPFTSN